MVCSKKTQIKASPVLPMGVQTQHQPVAPRGAERGAGGQLVPIVTASSTHHHHQQPFLSTEHRFNP